MTNLNCNSSHYPFPTTVISTRYRKAGGGHEEQDVRVEQGADLARLVEDLEIPLYLKTSLSAVFEALVEQVPVAESRLPDASDFVWKVYEELQRRKDPQATEATPASEASDSPPPDAKQVVKAAIKKLERSASREMLRMDGEVSDTPGVETPPSEFGTTATSSKPLQMDDPQLVNMKAELQEMGFSADMAAAALDITERDMERSIVLLLEDPSRVAEHASYLAMAPPSPSLLTTGLVASPILNEQPSLMKRSSSFFQQLKTLSTGTTPPESPSTPWRQFSARSFLQQQQTKLNVTSAPLKRVSSILGKAMAALTLDEEDRQGDDTSYEPELSESFTIYFGTQVKTMYNMRLQVSVLEDVFRPPPDAAQDLATRAQSANALYSQSLAGVILLVHAKDFAKYGGGRTPNAGMSKKINLKLRKVFTTLYRQYSLIGASAQLSFILMTSRLNCSGFGTSSRKASRVGLS
ncbi:hypothetical protein HDV00_009946 [Rhizophlyctis rosea]|nr:hypothetical protein HDV00_009946 [Rhizophlyctis rosea]